MTTFAPTPVTSFWRRLTRGVRILRQSTDWAKIVGADWADRIMQIEVTDRFHAKQGRSIARWTVSRPSSKPFTVYLKRHYRLKRSSGWLATFFPWKVWSPGLQEWEHLQWAQANGFPVPRPVAAGEWIGPWGKLQSFLAVEELTGMLALHEAIPLAQTRLTSSDFQKWKRGLVKELARLTKELHSRKHYHKDLYLCHFYILESDIFAPPDNWHNRVTMIDFHRLSHHSITGLWYQIKDLAQLLYSSEIPGVNVRDQIAFWRTYRKRDSRWKRFLGWCVRRKWRLYRRHNQK
jgi:hypothetical protein